MRAPERIEVETTLPAPPEEVYVAWLDGDAHGEMTGGEATCDPRVGGAYTAWEGYISGRILELDPPTRIVQSWRSTEFPPGAPDSRLEVELSPGEGGGTRLALRHSEIPAGQGERYRQGWEDHYFAPMREWFAARR